MDTNLNPQGLTVQEMVTPGFQKVINMAGGGQIDALTGKIIKPSTQTAPINQYQTPTPSTTPTTPTTPNPTSTPADTNPLPGESYSDYQARLSTNNPAPAAPTTTPDVLSSDDYVRRKQAIQDQLAVQKANIESDYARRLQERQMEQEEQRATEKAIQVKTGQAGTNYAADQTNRANTLRNSILDQLASDKQKLIMQAEAAASSDDWTAYHDIKKELQDNQDKADKLAYEKKQDMFNQYVQLKGLGINEAQEKRAQDTLAYNMTKEANKNKQDLIDAQNKTEIDLMKDGYTKLVGPSSLSGLTEKDIIRVPNQVTGGEDVYKKPVSAQKLDTQVVTAGGRSLLIDMNTGKTIKDLGGAYKTGGGGGGPQPAIGISKQDKQSILNNLQKVVGSDNKVNPQDYNAALNDWMKAGGSATDFHTEMAGLRNPNNPNYGLTKEKAKVNLFE